jgi:hypothetical protein
MPIIWIGFSTESPPEIHARRRTPERMKEFVAGVVEKAGGSLVELYFEVERERACALVANLDNYVKLNSVIGVLGADEATKLLLPDQRLRALRQQKGFRDAGTKRAGPAKG